MVLGKDHVLYKYRTGHGDAAADVFISSDDFQISIPSPTKAIRYQGQMVQS